MPIVFNRRLVLYVKCGIILRCDYVSAKLFVSSFVDYGQFFLRAADIIVCLVLHSL